MKVSIIGGGGLVGSCAGFALQAGKIVRHIHLVDVNQEACEGQALDLLHGASLMADQVIASGGYEHIPTSDLICITAGLRRKPDSGRSRAGAREPVLRVDQLKPQTSDRYFQFTK